MNEKIERELIDCVMVECRKNHSAAMEDPTTGPALKEAIAQAAVAMFPMLEDYTKKTIDHCIVIAKTLGAYDVADALARFRDMEP